VDSVSRPDFIRLSGASTRKVDLIFGSYNGLVEAAGLISRKFPSSDAPTYSDEDLVKEIIRVLRLSESKLTRVFFEQNSRVSPSSIERRFGGWLSAIRVVGERLDPENDAGLIRRIKEYVGVTAVPRRIVKPEPEEPAGVAVPIPEDLEEPPGHQLLDQQSTNIYGDFINFRGLQHAPVNEQGVVFLFGMVCREIGYVVEIVKPGFPDCEAKRRVSGKAGLWQRVRIEFEFHSRNFRQHGHDPDQCDLIVCWEDNWPECPIEVLALRSVISRISSAVPAE